MKRTEKIYISAPLRGQRIELRDINLDRIKRVYAILANAGYDPEIPPEAFSDLHDSARHYLTRKRIMQSSRIFAIPHNNGLIPASMWQEIIYARTIGVPVAQFAGERDLDRWINAKIITLTGASGAGKTTVAKELLKKKLKLVTSVTTREPRESDLPGEYRYVTPKEFLAMKEREEFLWPKPDEELPIHGKMYGTTKQDVDEALNAEHQSVMLLVPDVLDTLYEYALNRVWSFYILSPPEDALRARLEERGDKAEDIAKRITDCKMWDAEARKSLLPYTFINNNGTVQRTLSQISIYMQ